MALAKITCLIFANFIFGGAASEFLKAQPKELHETLSEEGIRTSLLEEIELAFGTGSASKHLAELEASLTPIYNSLPKNEHGRLVHSTVRYALHRLFVLRHGWNIKGLGANGGTWNSSSLTGVLKDQVPAYIQDMFEKRLGEKGLGLQELAVFAATIEHLIHTEAVAKLGDVFSLLDLLPTSTLSEQEGYQVLDTYMSAFILGENLTNLTRSDALELTAQMPELYLSWGDTQQFVRDIHKRTAKSSSEDSLQPFDFAMLAKIVEAIGEEFGSFQDHECVSLKKSLMAMEDRSTGRVKLSDFYKPALSAGAWQFQESVGYLRQVGALDESGSGEASVIMTNYLYSHANCIASSGYYSVCCKEECEGLLGHLEQKLVAPEAVPSEILSIVTKLESSTVSVPRNLSATLLGRLDDIANHHGGMIPLHGRLFAQWMHHAFPHECPYPHLSDTTNQQTADQWLSESGIDSTATEEEMMQFTNFTKSASSQEVEQEPEEITQWSYEEELLVERHSSILRKDLTTLPPMLRSLMLLIAACTLAFGMVQSFKTSLSMPVETAKFVV
mmetsp:Transcript_44526/g.69393  ORF Transcript_44526/g.69393 Transcript_44526/m.69393 type:complete len:558 (-) Transcript_44526:52-1725(-)